MISTLHLIKPFSASFRQVAQLHSSMRALKLAEAKLQNVDSVQADYMLHDQCILVDEQDKVIGSASKGACHHVDSAALHRAFSVFLFTPDRKLVLQKRSASKITFPLVWTNSCCSHPLCAEDEMEPEDDLGVRRAASRKLEHELGIKDMSVERLNVMGRFLYKASSDSEWMEHELDYALVVTDFNPHDMTPNPEEVAGVVTVDQTSLAAMLKNKKFSPWFELFHQFRFLNSWWDNLSALDSLKDRQRIHRLN